jgi:low temperature requirement protein LtrA
MFYGNNLAYLTERPERTKIFCKSLYLFTRATLLSAEIFNSLFIPWLRKLVFITLLLYLPGIGLWTAGIYINGIAAVGPIIAAVIWEYAVPVIVDSPLFRRLVPSEYGKAVDPHHLTSRMMNFFIITLGEGVLQLIKDGPL